MDQNWQLFYLCQRVRKLFIGNSLAIRKFLVHLGSDFVYFIYIYFVYFSLFLHMDTILFIESMRPSQFFRYLITFVLTLFNNFHLYAKRSQRTGFSCLLVGLHCQIYIAYIGRVMYSLWHKRDLK